MGKIYSTTVLRYQADLENERRWVSWDLLCGQEWKPLPWWAVLRALNSGKRQPAYSVLGTIRGQLLPSLDAALDKYLCDCDMSRLRRPAVKRQVRLTPLPLRAISKRRSSASGSNAIAGGIAA